VTDSHPAEDDRNPDNAPGGPTERNLRRDRRRRPHRIRV